MPTPTTLPGGLEGLLAVGKNRDNFRRLEEQVRSPLGVVPFVGAGLSIPCGLCGWESFLLEEASAIERQDEVAERLRRGEYEEAAELLLRELGARAFADALDSQFGQHRPTAADLRGPVLRVPRLSHGPVLTTNFDRVLERSFELAERPFQERVWGAKPDLFARALHENRRYLLKIHGDVTERTERVLTLQDYERHYGNGDIAGVDLARPLPRILEQTFTTRVVLFIGCSLAQDRTLRLLKRVADVHAAPPAHYAIVPRPRTSPEAVARARFLAEHNIRPLWFPEGEYGAVDVFLEALEKHVNP